MFDQYDYRPIAELSWYDACGNYIWHTAQTLDPVQRDNLNANIGVTNQSERCPYCNCKIDSTKTHCASCGAPC